MNEDIMELFGDLRSMLSSGDPNPREMYWLLEQAYNADPDAYKGQWYEYLVSYSPLDVLITSLDELEMLEKLFPPGVLQNAKLTMTGHHIRKWHFQFIAESRSSWFLGALDISNNRAQNHYPIAFEHTDYLLNLRDLDMSGCDLSALVGSWVLRAEFLASVETLNLSNNPLDMRALSALANNPNTNKIKKLSLVGCGIQGDLLEELLNTDHFASLSDLDLRDNPLNSGDIVRFGSYALTERLTSLELPWEKLTMKDRKKLLDSPLLSEELKDYIFDKTVAPILEKST